MKHRWLKQTKLNDRACDSEWTKKLIYQLYLTQTLILKTQIKNKWIAKGSIRR